MTSGLRKLSASAGRSLYATLFGGFAALLHRLTEQEDLVVGIAAAGQMASEMHSLVGHCVNLLPIRIAADAQTTFDALAGRASSTLLDSFEHQNLTYGTLLKKLPVARDPSRLPLVSVLFNVDSQAPVVELPGLTVESSTIPRAFENFELFLNVVPQAGGMQMEAQYNADLFDQSTISRWLSMYECLLRSALRDPLQTVAELDLLSATDIRALVDMQPAPLPLAGLALAHAGFAAQAAVQPERPALRHGAEQMSYGELEAQSNKLAHALRARGVAREQRVGLCLERGNEMVVALLAVLKAGAAYVPLDPAFPQARLDYYAQDAQLSLLVTNSSVAAAPRAWCVDAAQRVLLLDLDQDWKQQSASPLAPSGLDAQSEDAAYVIYTSGSTGKPKGVCVPHRAVANFLQSMQREPGIAAQDRMAAVTTLSFDIAVAELLLPLAAGAEAVVVPRDVAMDGNRLRALLEAEQITVLQATPGMWRLLLDAQWPGAPGFRAWIGGESVPADLALELLDRATELWNLYGPTETTVWSTIWRMQRDAIATRGVSIGRPIANTTVWILDAQRRPCPAGVPGELCIGGDGVTLGYLERPELTAERFVDVVIDGKSQPMYRTGDRGRWRNDGLLEHMGRFDFQVKVRGYRIELGEIEARCNETAGVARSVVVAREDQPGDVRLVAYLALSTQQSFDAAALDRHLRNVLPQYMVPQHVVMLDALPLLPNGKIDRKALPPPEATANARQGSERVPPRTERERVVLEAMERVLNVPAMGIQDDFFALGGHSLLAARLATLLSREFDLMVPLSKVFESSTAERLAAAVGSLSDAGVARRITITHQRNRRHAPLTPMQERIRFIEELHPGRPVYNAPSGHRFLGPLDLVKFKAAFCEIVRRQSALRTAIGSDPQTGVPVQVVADAVEFDFPLIDLSGLPEEEREASLKLRMQKVADESIDIHRAPLFHVALFRLTANDHAFVFVPHHLIWDGWSFDLYQIELAAIYAAMQRDEPHALPPLAVTLGDYGQWYQDWMAQPAFLEQVSRWNALFAKAPTPRAPRTDRRRRAGMSGEGGSHWISVEKALADKLRQVARQHDVTLSMLMLGLYAAMMAGVIDTDAVVIATPVRGREAPELEPVMGFFNNILPLPFRIDRAQQLSDFLRDVKRDQIAVMDIQQVPFERLVSEPEFAQRAQGSGLYQALFSFQDARERPLEFGDLRHQQMHLLQRGATDDLGLWLMDKPQGLEGAVVYNADIYLSETGAAFKDRYLELLRAVVERADCSIGQLLDPGESASAQYLRRLAWHNAAPATPLAVDAAASAAKAVDAGATLLDEEANLARIWASALHIDISEIRANDNFFDLGGDSLLAMRVIQTAEKVLGFGVEPRRYVFESLGQLALANANAVEPHGNAQQPEAGTAQNGFLGRVFGAWRRKA